MPTSFGKKVRNRVLKWAGVSGLDSLPDERFLEEVYRRLLGRGVDPTGRDHYLNYLRQGNSRLSLVLSIVQSEEYTNTLIRENTPTISIREERPDQYALVKDIHGRDTLTFRSRQPPYP